jgi:hypothetical protein
MSCAISNIALREKKTRNKGNFKESKKKEKTAANQVMQ